MAGTLFWIDAIQVFIGAEDHPPPHVHAVHTEEGWVARFRFSFLSDVTGLYRFRRRGRMKLPRFGGVMSGLGNYGSVAISSMAAS